MFDHSFRSSAGLDGRYHFYVVPPRNAQPARSPGLLVYLHGDDAEDFDERAWALDGIAAAAARHQLHTLAIRTPARDVTWWMDPPHNGPFVAELINEAVLERHDVDTARILLVGFSGGAEFLSSWFVPVHAQGFCGGASLVFGGGSPPWGGAAFEVAIRPAFAAAHRLHFYTGERDELLSNSVAGARHYRSLGFRVTEEHPGGVGHLDIPFTQVLEEQLAAGIIPPG